MNYKTIYHCKTIQVQQYVNDKIGLEDSFPKEKPDAECIRELNDRIEEMAKIAYPWLYEQKQPKGYSVNANGETFYIPNKVNGIETNSVTVTDLPPLEHRIRSCMSINELELCEKKIDEIKDQKEKTRHWLIYDEIYAKLQKQTVSHE